MMRREQFKPNQKLYDDYYGAQAGYGLPVFIGAHNYRGGGLGNFLAGLGRTIIPLLKRGGKALLKEGLKTGIGTVKDVLEGKKFGESLKDRSKTAGKRLLSNAVDTMTSANKRIKKTTPQKPPQLKTRRRKKKKAKDIFSS